MQDPFKKAHPDGDGFLFQAAGCLYCAIYLISSHHQNTSNLVYYPGLTELIASDNTASFTSGEFQEFTRKNGIHHFTSAPYCLAYNGLAAWAVLFLKDSLRK